MTQTFINNKNKKNQEIKKKYGILLKFRPLGLIKISNKEIIKELRDGLLTTQAGYILEIEGAENEKIGKNIVAVSKIEDRELVGFDFVVCDKNIQNLEKYLKNGIVPIISKNSYYTKTLQEFNPIKSEGNSFFYEEENKWCIFSGIIKYIENYKFPFDNKTLLKNTLNYS